MKKIVVLATGGTIAGSSTSSLSGKYESGKIDINDILDSFDEIKDIAKVCGIDICNIGSQNMNENIWLELARKCNELLSSNEVDAIVITHGTDTLEESAYFLNLTIKSHKPVVMSAAMRSHNSLSSDGAINLYNAISVAAADESAGMGVLVVINDEIHLAREVSKMDTIALNAFSSPNCGKCGIVHYGKVKFYTKSLRQHTLQSKFNPDILPRVDILYDYAGAKIETLYKSNAIKGIVCAALGNGNLSPQMLKFLKSARDNEVVVVISSRVNGGVINGSELDFAELGFIASDSLNPQKSRVLLMLSLSSKEDIEKIRDNFDIY
ncbi:asparaginase [Campylobacter vicugnae]|uniref:asparaginase n=1 Tax=Campylobacter vicugnae TaxID=1660076 RepID=UPI0038B2CD9E